MTAETFTDKLAFLVAFEMEGAKGDPDRMGIMIERLAAALGFTVAIAAHGDGETIDRLLTGAEGYAHAEAVDKARLARFMADVRNSVRKP